MEREPVPSPPIDVDAWPETMQCESINIREPHLISMPVSLVRRYLQASSIGNSPVQSQTQSISVRLVPASTSSIGKPHSHKDNISCSSSSASQDNLNSKYPQTSKQFVQILPKTTQSVGNVFGTTHLSTSLLRNETTASLNPALHDIPPKAMSFVLDANKRLVSVSIADKMSIQKLSNQKIGALGKDGGHSTAYQNSPTFFDKLKHATPRSVNEMTSLATGIRTCSKEDSESIINQDVSNVIRKLVSMEKAASKSKETSNLKSKDKLANSFKAFQNNPNSAFVINNSNGQVVLINIAKQNKNSSNELESPAIEQNSNKLESPVIEQSSIKLESPVIEQSSNKLESPVIEQSSNKLELPVIEQSGWTNLKDLANVPDEADNSVQYLFTEAASSDDSHTDSGDDEPDLSDVDENLDLDEFDAERIIHERCVHCPPVDHAYSRCSSQSWTIEFCESDDCVSDEGAISLQKDHTGQRVMVIDPDIDNLDVDIESSPIYDDQVSTENKNSSNPSSRFSDVQFNNGQALSEWTIDSVYSLAPDSMDSELKDAAVASQNHPLESVSYGPISLKDFSWKQYCKTAYVVLDRMSHQEMKSSQNKLNSIQCSPYCRKRTLRMLCDLQLLTCDYRENLNDFKETREEEKKNQDWNVKNQAPNNNVINIEPNNFKEGAISLQKDHTGQRVMVINPDIDNFDDDIESSMIYDDQVSTENKNSCSDYYSPENEYKLSSGNISNHGYEPMAFKKQKIDLRQNAANNERFVLYELKNQVESKRRLMRKQKILRKRRHYNKHKSNTINGIPVDPEKWLRAVGQLRRSDNLYRKPDTVTHGDGSISYLINGKIVHQPMSRPQNETLNNVDEAHPDDRFNECLNQLKFAKVYSEQNTSGRRTFSFGETSFNVFQTPASDSDVQNKITSKTPIPSSVKDSKDSSSTASNTNVPTLSTQGNIAKGQPVTVDKSNAKLKDVHMLDSLQGPFSSSSINVQNIPKKGICIQLLKSTSYGTVAAETFRKAVASLRSKLSSDSKHSTAEGYFLVKVDGQELWIRTYPYQLPSHDSSGDKISSSTAVNSLLRQGLKHTTSQSSNCKTTTTSNNVHQIDSEKTTTPCQSSSQTTPNLLSKTKRNESFITTNNPSHNLITAPQKIPADVIPSNVKETVNTVSKQSAAAAVSTQDTGSNVSTSLKNSYSYLSSILTMPSNTLLDHQIKSSSTLLSPEFQIQRRLKRKRLEEKYPLPPGVVIKSEPLTEGYGDNSWSATSELDSGYTAQQNAVPGYQDPGSDNSDSVDRAPVPAQDTVSQQSFVGNDSDSNSTIVVDESPPVLEPISSFPPTLEKHCASPCSGDSSNSPPKLHAITPTLTALESNYGANTNTNNLQAKNRPSATTTAPVLSMFTDNTTSMSTANSEVEPIEVDCEESGYETGTSSSLENLSSSSSSGSGVQGSSMSRIQKLKQLLKVREKQLDRLRKIHSMLPALDLDSVE